MKTTTPQRPARRRFSLTWWRIGLMLFALLAVIGLTADLVSLRLRAEKAVKEDGLASLAADTLIDITIATNRWCDPAGRFSIRLPATWTAVPGTGEPYDLTLRGPLRMELNVQVRPVEPGGMEGLLERLGEIETNLHLTTSIQADQFRDRPAWRRTMPLNKSKLEALDFIQVDQAVHLLMSAPPDAFDDLRPALVELRDSFQLEGSAHAP